MEKKTLAQLEAEINNAFKVAHHGADDRIFSSNDEFMLAALLEGKEKFAYNADRHTLVHETMSLDTAPYALVITYEFNPYCKQGQNITLSLNLRNTTYCLPLTSVEFDPSAEGALKRAIDTLYVRAHAVKEGLKAEP